MYGEWTADKGISLNVHIWESVLTERALKYIYSPITQFFNIVNT